MNQTMKVTLAAAIGGEIGSLLAGVVGGALGMSESSPTLARIAIGLAGTVAGTYVAVRMVM